MIVRQASEADISAWAAMRHRLWPDQDPVEMMREACEMPRLDPPCVGLVAVDEDGRLIGFLEVGVRSYAEGGPSAPAAYVEGVWVEPDHRRKGVARGLLAAAEGWARERGLTHIGSDALLDNDASHAWHRAAGFDEVERLVVFGKSIG